MGLFTPEKTTRIKGTIARIGVIHGSDNSLEYGFTLEGGETRYRARAYPLRAEWELALAMPGDRISFVVRDKHPDVVHDDLKTHAADHAGKGASS